MLAAVVAFLTFNWFFVNPVHTLVVEDPGEWVTLVLFLRTAVVTGQLAAGQRRRAEAAKQRAQAAVLRARLQEQASEVGVLRRSDELKDTLLNAVSHNLRTPLASIITRAGSLRRKDLDWTGVERREMAEAIEQEAARLNGIVTNLLDLSRIEAGGLAPVKEWHELSALVDDVAGRLAPLAAHHELEVPVPDCVPPVPLDWVQIDQVLSNLLENATRHTPPGTRATISAESVGGEVRVMVEDSGPGFRQRRCITCLSRFSQEAGLRRRPELAWAWRWPRGWWKAAGEGSEQRVATGAPVSCSLFPLEDYLPQRTKTAYRRQGSLRPTRAPDCPCPPSRATGNGTGPIRSRVLVELRKRGQNPGG